MRNINVDGYQQISKAKAQHLYNDGKTVYLCAAKMRPGGMWQCAHDVELNRDGDFAAVCNSFMWYNCTAETGRYIRYYVKESE